MTNRIILGWIAIAFSCIAGVSLAQEKKSLDDLIKAATVDMPISTAPASFLLGASGENVPRLSSFRTFSAQAARAFDDTGKVANAVAVELAPGLALGRTSWEDIQSSQGSRIWSRTMVSFATKPGSDNQGAQSAVGLQAILYAPAMEEALLKAADDSCRSANIAIDASPPKEPGDKRKEISKEVLDKIAKCQTEIDGILTKWNQPMVAVGIGRKFTSADAEGNPKPKDTSAFWLTAAYGGDFPKEAEKKPESTERLGYLVTGHFRQTSNVNTTTVANAEALAKQRLVGINARGGNAKMAGIGEFSVTSSKATGADFKDRKRALLGLEFRVDKDIYLTLGVARDTGLDVSKQSVLAKLNWGFSKTPVLISGQ